MKINETPAAKALSKFRDKELLMRYFEGTAARLRQEYNYEKLKDVERRLTQAAVEMQIELDVILDLLSKAPYRTQPVLYAKYLEGKTGEQISKELFISDAEVWRRHRAGLDAINKIMEEGD